MSVLNTEKLCRICVNESVAMKNIANDFISCDGKEFLVLNVLKALCVIKENDCPNYPKTICLDCLHQAVRSYSFKLCCDRSNALLDELLSKNNHHEDINELFDCLSELDLYSEVGFIDKIDVDEVIATKASEIHLDKNANETDTPKGKKHNKLSDSNLYICAKCNKSFTDKYAFLAHDKRHQYNGKFICSTCKKAFNSKACLDRHSRIHTGERNYECATCHKRFPSSNRMKLHQRTHNGQKPYLCTVCGKNFSLPTGLTYHMRTHTKEKPYACDTCGKEFAVSCHLTRHMKIHSGERPFACSKCEKAFIKKIDLKRHEDIHLNIRNHVCSICSKRFFRKNHLNHHMMLHTAERPFKCDTCGKGFTRVHGLKNHLSKNHNDTEYVFE